jgi:phosphatidylglycerol:prolipoprotein diacylglycerol transferase
MHRVLFQKAGVTIYSYTAILYLGIVCGIYAQLYAAVRIGLNPTRTLAATLLLLAGALIGSKLMYFATHARSNRQNAGRFLRSAESGAAMYGGLLVAAAASLPVLAVLKLPFGSFWDSASFTMLIGMILTRVGCLLNGCCGGRPSMAWYAIALPDAHGVRKRRIPSQVLEAVWGSAVLAGAIAVFPRRPFPGAVFLYSLGVYAAGRIVLESTREVQDRVAGASLNCVISVGVAAASLAAYAIILWR